MSNTLSKIITIFLWVLMGVSLVFAVIFYFGDVVAGTEGTNMEEPVITSSFLVWAAALLGVAAVATLIFSLINVILFNPKGIKMVLLSLVIFAIVIFAAYSIADDTVLYIPSYDGPDNVPSTLKWAGTALNTTYILAGLAVLSIFWDGVSKVFK